MPVMLDSSRGEGDNMEIYNVPEKAKLLYLNAQYFHNERSRGVTEHVIKIQYKAKRGKDQNFVMPLSTLVKEINRKARAKLSAEDAALVKTGCSDLKAQGKRFGFGFRQVTITEKSEAGARLFHRQQEPTVFCWVLFEEDHIRLELSWLGESISIRIPPHKATALTPGQSMGIGYWDRKRDPGLANRIAALAARSAARNAGAEARLPEVDGSLRVEPEKVEIAQHPAPLRPRKALAKRTPEKATSQKPISATTDGWGVWQPEAQPKLGQGLGWSVGLPDRPSLQTIEVDLGSAV
jgi:hypothetical protein